MPQPVSGCSEFRRTAANAATRRDALQLGGVSLLSAGLMNVLAGRVQATQKKPRIKSCLLLFQAGGVSQTDTFDMKPESDVTIRGEFRPIESNVPGMPLCEHLPRMARHMDKVCVVRSMHHRMLCHNPAIYAALSGREVGESLAVSNRTFATREDYPHLGAVVSRLIENPPRCPRPCRSRLLCETAPLPVPASTRGSWERRTIRFSSCAIRIPTISNSMSCNSPPR